MTLDGSQPGAGPRVPKVAALEAGARMLAGRPHARQELARKLIRRGHDPEEVETAIARLAALGYLDDEAFARSLVERRAPSRGRLAVAAELAERGVDRDVAGAALAGLTDRAQLVAAARIARRVMAGRDSGLEEVLRIAGPRLGRRGFSSQVIVAACREVAQSREE